MKLKGKIRLFFAIVLCNVFLAGVCLSAAEQNMSRSGRGIVGDMGSLRTADGMTAGNSAAAGNSVVAGNPAVADSAAAVGSEQLLALTFDDGPHRTHTGRLLDGLKERGVKASFFLVGENIPGNEELVRRMAEEGHFIGVHCYSHVDLTKKKAEDSCRDILKTAEMIEEITGSRPEYIRPPYGSWNAELEECVEMLPVFWDIDTLDWKTQNSRKILAHIVKQAGKHQVVLMHDVFSTSVDAALAAVDTLAKQGYTFVTVDELLID